MDQDWGHPFISQVAAITARGVTILNPGISKTENLQPSTSWWLWFGTMSFLLPSRVATHSSKWRRWPNWHIKSNNKRGITSGAIQVICGKTFWSIQNSCPYSNRLMWLWMARLSLPSETSHFYFAEAQINVSSMYNNHSQQERLYQQNSKHIS